MSTKGQTINDRYNAAKYTLAGQALARCICKATTEELMRPKKKHLDYLAACTYESNVSMLQLANMLIERTNHSNWAVVYKSLITVHHLMSFGSERFTQYLASTNYSFQLSGFLDRIVAKGYAMSTFIRRYSNYINQKALSYRQLAVDLCRTQRGEDNVLRTMPIERLLETLPVIQKQLDTLIDFGCTANDLSNSIITASFTLLFHDCIRLFASYNDGIINLFEKYFDLNKKMCREAFETYKKFLAATDRVAEFLKVGDAINLDRGEIPDFKRAPSSLLDALEQHLLSLESSGKNKTAGKVVIDTKFATFPSFSANTSLDFSPPQMAKMATELDSKLSFETSQANNDFFNYDEFKPNDSANATTESVVAPSSTTSADLSNSLSDIILQPPATFNVQPASSGTKSIDPLDLASDFDAQLSIQSSNPRDFENDSTFGSSKPQPKPISDTKLPQPTAGPAIVSPYDVFDANPPGYFGNTLLTPETTVQIKIDPSIDPHTQQQLINIQREQAATKHKQQNSSSFANLMNSNSATNKSNNNNYASTRSTNSNKAKQESIFEDLEQTMRQSLQKVEKA